MARKPSVRAKNGYWFSNAKGMSRYFGRCSEVSYADAMAMLWASIAEMLAQSESSSEILLDNASDDLLECRRRQANANSNANSKRDRKSEGKDREGKREEEEEERRKAKAKALAFSLSPESTDWIGLKFAKAEVPSPSIADRHGLKLRTGLKFAKAKAEGKPKARISIQSSPPIHRSSESRKPVPSSPRTPPNLSLPEPSQEPSLIVDALAEAFLAWVEANRGPKAHKERSRHLKRFREANGDEEAIAIDGSHIEAFTSSLLAKGYALDYVHKHLVSVGAMFRKGIRKGWILNVNPFASVEPIRLPPKALSEHDLPTPEEYQSLIAHAKPDIKDMLVVYHATGMRTHELLQATVGDFQRSTHQIVMANHKRSHTMRESKPRTVTLNAEAEAIILRYCEGKPSSLPIFPRPNGEPKTSANLGLRFQALRKRAGVRNDITIYSFRHLWISEMLQAGLDSMLVARMAGTSVKMIETVYGHFRTQSLAEAQAKLDAMRGA